MTTTLPARPTPAHPAAHTAAPPTRPGARNHPGFVLYVGVDAAPGENPRPQLVELAEALGELARDTLPGAETYTALALGEPTPGVTSSDPDLPASAVRDIAAFRAQLAALSPVPRVLVDSTRRTVSVDGRPQHLTQRELDLLAYLARSSDHVVTRAELLATVWQGHAVSAQSRTVDVHVRRLREKLGLEHAITTVRGVGYRFDPHASVVLTSADDAA
ncbi:winged helix-turn-helix domain-containing protein [Oerskovia flava]|uniref:winged helix-turn-helix domain-containing protein n=1 Tax=Oerskovia flava TaxID=2986422 RepID=UPI002AD487F7|nr:winged helix-turn-helix domain-containing protein [Oerskovia sp. JB1-3-2]